MDEGRFAGILGDDYKLLKFAYPHHDEFQQFVAQQISAYLASNKIDNPIVLEGGCGSGVSTLEILKHNPNTHVIGVDNEQKMLDQAKEILEDYLDKVEFVKDDLLTFLKSKENGSIDVFVAIWTLHNLKPDYRQELFQEIARVLKPNGLFISGDKYAVTDENTHQEQLTNQLNRFRSYKDIGNAELADAWVKHNEEDDTIKMTEEGQQETLKELGFRDVKTVYRKDMEAIIVGIKE